MTLSIPELMGHSPSTAFEASGMAFPQYLNVKDLV